MNLCAGEYPPEVDEFQLSGLTPIPSDLVKAPRVAESHINMECRLALHHFDERPGGGGNLVLGEVIRFHIDDAYFTTIGSTRTSCARLAAWPATAIRERWIAST
jgi:flavin reductase (DIM6/NTAB) family NADH-FMN oxidoreductase RutF